MPMNLNLRLSMLAAICLSHALLAPAYAQDEQAAQAGTQETPPVVAAKPNPAEIAQKASEAQINDLASAGNAIVAVGERGIILRSTDGKDWKQIVSPVDVLLNSVFFLDSQNGWAVGHDAAIITTRDGGQSWALQSFSPGLNKPLMDVIFLDAQKGFSVGAYGLFKVTVDGGATWSDFVDPVFEESQPHLNALARLRDGSLVLVGEGGLVAVSEDGTSWRAVPLDYKGSLFSVAPRGEHGAVVAGMRGNVYAAEDLRVSGDSGPADDSTAVEPVSTVEDANAVAWKQLKTGSTRSLFGLASLGGDDLVAVGSVGTALIFRSGAGTTKLKFAPTSNNTESSLFTSALYWRNNLVIATDRGFKKIGIAKPKT